MFRLQELYIICNYNIMYELFYVLEGLIIFIIVVMPVFEIILQVASFFKALHNYIPIRHCTFTPFASYYIPLIQIQFSV